MSYARIDLKLQPQRKKMNIDNKARFGYLDGYCRRLIGVSICWDAAETNTQFTIFDSSALKNQYLISLSLVKEAIDINILFVLQLSEVLMAMIQKNKKQI